MRQVKIIGVLGMIDEGETDWKLVGIDVRDPRAASINTLEDVEKHMRGYLAATVEWFRIYKIPAGKPENKFAFDGEFQGKVGLGVGGKEEAGWKVESCDGCLTTPLLPTLLPLPLRPLR